MKMNVTAEILLKEGFMAQYKEFTAQHVTKLLVSFFVFYVNY